MPEGPEIRKAADKVEKAVLAAPLQQVYFAFDHLKPFEKRLGNKEITGVETRGKAMLIHFSNKLAIYSHNQLYGRWMIRNAGNMPNTGRQLRLALYNQKKSALLYSASDIEVLTRKQVQQHPFLSRLGPDIMSTDPNAVMEQLQSKRFQRRQFSALYLDQHFLAGVGNYLRSEILFLAGLHPRLRPCDCSEEQLQTLSKLSISLPRQSYRHNGVTNNLKLSRQLKAEGKKRNEYRHWVFSRAGKKCHQCGGAIVKDVAASRRFYYCPCCQPIG